MATLGVKSPNLADFAKEKIGGTIARLISLYEDFNPIVFDGPAIEGNLDNGHRSLQTVTRPTGTWRAANQGVDEEKATSKMVTDVCGELYGMHKLDSSIYDMNGGNEYRRRQVEQYGAGMTQEIAETIIYGNVASSPLEFQGIFPRYNSLSGNYADQVISGSGSGSDNRSILLMTWGESTCHLFFPKGTKAGLEMNDLGKQPVTDGDSKTYTAYLYELKWRIGLAIPNYKQIVRICNIDKSDLTNDASSGADIVDLMITAIYRLPTATLFDTGRVFYVPKVVAEYLQKQISNKSNVNLTPETAGGTAIGSFMGIPIRMCDALDTDEATVS